jgi:DNA modification methylase
VPDLPDVKIIPISGLRPSTANARTHSRRQIRQIAASIKRFGFTVPILVDDDGQIIAGHGRVEAAKLLGRSEVPSLRLSHLSPAEKRAYMIADNRLAEKAGWDREILAIELQGLIDLHFDVELTGFEMGEIDVLLGEAEGAKAEGAGPEDEVPDLRPHAVTRSDDLWILGKHRLLCGDARADVAYEHLLGGEKAEFVFTDPPYNVPTEGQVCGLGDIHHREFAMAGAEMTPQVFTDFLKTVFRNLVTHTNDGSVHGICTDWRHVLEMMTAGNEVYTDLKNICVWVKRNAGAGTFYRSRHKLIFVWKAGTGPHVNNIQLSRFRRNRTDVWEYAGNSMHPGEELAMHPTVKPVALVADAIKDCSRRNSIVLDPFCGCGTTLIAAERTGRCARGIEFDSVYVDVAVRRWQTYTGKTAILAQTSRTFQEIEEERQRTRSAAVANDLPPREAR